MALRRGLARNGILCVRALEQSMLCQPAHRLFVLATHAVGETPKAVLQERARRQRAGLLAGAEGAEGAEGQGGGVSGDAEGSDSEEQARLVMVDGRHVGVTWELGSKGAWRLCPVRA